MSDERHAAVAADDERPWPSLVFVARHPDVVETMSLVPGDAVADRRTLLRENLFRGGESASVVVGAGEADDEEAARGMSLLQIGQALHPAEAGAAPRRPDVEDVHLALLPGANRPSFEPDGARQRRRRVADARPVGRVCHAGQEEREQAELRPHGFSLLSSANMPMAIPVASGMNPSVQYARSGWTRNPARIPTPAPIMT